jgi:hypothetical protein
MSIIFGLLILLGVLFIGITILGYYLPNHWQIEKAVIVNTDKEFIFPLINTIKNWQDWSVWNSDHKLDIEYSGPMTGVGASKKWDGNQIKGKITITKSVSSNTIEFDIKIENDKFNIKNLIVIEATMPAYSQVAWRAELNIPKNFNPIYRYQAYFLKSYMESSMAESLRGLQAIFERNEEIEELDSLD